MALMAQSVRTVDMAARSTRETRKSEHNKQTQTLQHTMPASQRLDGVAGDRKPRRTMALPVGPTRTVVARWCVRTRSHTVVLAHQITMHVEQGSRSSLHAVGATHTCQSHQVERDGSR